MTGVRLSVIIGCSEGTGKEGRADTCSFHQDMTSVKSSLKMGINRLKACG